MHESQSRLWENHVGRSDTFWQTWFPVACEFFPQLRALELDDFLAVIRRAEKSFIRVEADEATYDLHILLRFDLERRLVRGQLAVKDVPAAWNDGFRDLFGMTPPDDRHGCLQDIHWSMGGLGYFATYTLGNIAAAQLFAAAKRQPAIAHGLANTDHAPLLAWLRQHIHAHGCTHTSSELVRLATGTPPSADDYLARPFDLEELHLRSERLLGSRIANLQMLQGDLKNHPLWALLQYLKQVHKSGSLRVRGATGSGTVEIRNGDLLAARWQRLTLSALAVADHVLFRFPAIRDGASMAVLWAKR